MGVLPGQKFIWLKAKGNPNVAPESVRLNSRYLPLLKVPEGGLVEIVYEGRLLFRAKLEISPNIQRGYVFINSSRMAEFGVPEDEPVIVAELREKT